MRATASRGLPLLATASRASSSLLAGGSYSRLSELDVQHFASIVGAGHAITAPTELEPFNTDWMGKYRGQSALALRPGSTQEVSRILAHCHARRLPVVPQGGNTGLVGGSVPIADEIVLSLSRMNRIISLDETAGSLTCEAGCVLETLQQHVGARGFVMPLDLGAKGSCQIGGNLSTNAGGLRFLRYGSLRGSLLGLEAVLADGTVLDNLSPLRKDNTGYDLGQLFIGSEGTLGVVTGCSIALPPLPSSVHLAFLGLSSFDAVLAAYAAARRHLGETLSAVEFLDGASMGLVIEQQPGTRDPLQARCPFYMLVELSGSNAAHDGEKLDAYLEATMGDGVVADGTVARDSAQTAALWAIREGITGALARNGAVYKYDVSIPLDELYDLVEEMRPRVRALGAEVSGFGHLGDGNLHLNIHTPGVFETSTAVLGAIEPFVYEWVAARRGSISAEHGIGVMKPQFLHMSKSQPLIGLMRGVKTLLDPHNILNPGKVLPPIDGQAQPND